MVDSNFMYQYLTPPKIQEVVARCPLVLQPVGLLEWHGDHNAVGMDGLTSQRICERVIDRVGDGVLMPTCWIGTYGYVHYPGTLCYDGETAYRVYKNVIRECLKLGFRLVLVASGHGGKWQVRALEGARADALKEMAPALKQKVEVLAFVYPTLIPGISVVHAGEIETAMLWRIGQEYKVDLVDTERMPSGQSTIKKYTLPDDDTIDFPASEEPETWNWPPGMHDPSRCGPEAGEMALRSFADGVYEEIAAIREELGF
ncbi:MAG: creatininase family protein [Candidatus Lokiarchaeota archaeon]|nr:creatininase family protein [Candidatus Lokiarchaeota archaeon]